MKLHNLLLILSIAILTGCGKDEPVIPQEYLDKLTTQTPGSTTSPGTTTPGNTSPETTLDTYQPLTKGSFWKNVESSNFSTVDEASTITLTGKTKTINGKLYSEAVSVSDLTGERDTAYFYAANNNYILYSYEEDLEEILQFDYLHSNAAVNETWETPVTVSGSVVGVLGRLRGTLKEKGIKKTVKGKEYSNVIHTELVLQYNYNNAWETWATYNFYVAKGIGIIEIDTDMDIMGLSMSYKSQLTSYSIAK